MCIQLSFSLYLILNTPRSWIYISVPPTLGKCLWILNWYWRNIINSSAFSLSIFECIQHYTPASCVCGECAVCCAVCMYLHPSEYNSTQQRNHVLCVMCVASQSTTPFYFTIFLSLVLPVCFVCALLFSAFISFFFIVAVVVVVSMYISFAPTDPIRMAWTILFFVACSPFCFLCPSIRSRHPHPSFTRPTSHRRRTIFQLLVRHCRFSTENSE